VEELAPCKYLYIYSQMSTQDGTHSLNRGQEQDTTHYCNHDLTTSTPGHCSISRLSALPTTYLHLGGCTPSLAEFSPTEHKTTTVSPGDSSAMTCARLPSVRKSSGLSTNIALPAREQAPHAVIPS